MFKNCLNILIYNYVYIYIIVLPAEQENRYLKALTYRVCKNPNLLKFVINTLIFQYFLNNFFVNIALYIKKHHKKFH